MRGDLRQSSLADVMRHVYAERKSGILHVQRQSIRKRIYFKKGVAIFADGPDDNVMSRGQAEQLLQSLFTWTSGEFLFQDGEPNIAESLAFSSSPSDVILEGVRRIDHVEILQRLIGGRNTMFACTKTSVLPLFKMRLSPAESAILTYARERERFTADDLPFPSNELPVVCALNALVSVGLLEIVHKDAPPEPAPVELSPAPPPVSQQAPVATPIQPPPVQAAPPPPPPPVAEEVTPILEATIAPPEPEQHQPPPPIPPVAATPPAPVASSLPEVPSEMEQLLNAFEAKRTGGAPRPAAPTTIHRPKPQPRDPAAAPPAPFDPVQPVAPVQPVQPVEQVPPAPPIQPVQAVQPVPPVPPQAVAPPPPPAQEPTPPPKLAVTPEPAPPPPAIEPAPAPEPTPRPGSETIMVRADQAPVPREPGTEPIRASDIPASAPIAQRPHIVAALKEAIADRIPIPPGKGRLVAGMSAAAVVLVVVLAAFFVSGDDDADGADAVVAADTATSETPEPEPTPSRPTPTPEPVPAAEPEPSEAELFYRANLAFEGGDFELAKTELAKLLERQPELAAARDLMARVERELAPEPATTTTPPRRPTPRVVEREPEPEPKPVAPPPPTPADLFAQARAALRTGDLDLTRAKLNALKAVDPSYPGARALEDELADKEWEQKLPLAYSSRHDHALGGCDGVLTLTSRGYGYRSKDHEWFWSFAEIRVTDRRDARRLRLETSAGQSFNFQLRDVLSDADWTRYQRIAKR